MSRLGGRGICEGSIRGLRTSVPAGVTPPRSSELCRDNTVFRLVLLLFAGIEEKPDVGGGVDWVWYWGMGGGCSDGAADGYWDMGGGCSDEPAEGYWDMGGGGPD